MSALPTQPLPPRKDRMTGRSASAGASLLFLREDELRAAQDMLFFLIRDINAQPDAILSEFGYGRAHHRCLHWIARRPGLKVGELLAILDITKQSLTRVLGPLISDGYVKQTPGRKDRRQRLLTLTESGGALERQLFEAQRERLLHAYRTAGGAAVEGFKRVISELIGPQGHQILDGTIASPALPMPPSHQG